MTRTILVVEDQDSIRRLTRRVLSGAGYRVLEAGTGEEALGVVAEEADPIDLLVTDVIMPGLGGRALAERLLAEQPGLRVLFMSGYPDDSSFLHVLEAARVGFVQKPFSPASLVASVAGLLEPESE